MSMVDSWEQAALSPLLSPVALRRIAAMRQHAAAPAFNYVAGDRLIAEDLPQLDAFGRQLGTAATAPCGAPPQRILERVERWIATVPLYRQLHAARRGVLDRDWGELATVGRDELAARPARFTPDDQTLERLIMYLTSGTTGHAIAVPHHPVAVASYLPLIERALAARGVTLELGPEATACFLVGAQKRTVTYPTALTAWREAAFAKLNLDPRDWREEGDAERYFRAHRPQIFTGDPLTFSRFLRLDLGYTPKALISTAVAMNPVLRSELTRRLSTRVIDWYSLTETGPLACLAPDGDGYEPLAPDVHLETVGADGRPVPEGELGEITVTGGRNPFLPLVRYRTGDWGRLVRRGGRTRIVDLEGRRPVLFRTSDGCVLHPNDLAAVFRAFPIVQHETVQAEDLSVSVRVRAFDPDLPLDALREQLARLLGPVPRLSVSLDARLGDEAKVLPYQSAARLEE